MIHVLVFLQILYFQPEILRLIDEGLLKIKFQISYQDTGLVCGCIPGFSSTPHAPLLLIVWTSWPSPHLLTYSEKLTFRESFLAPCLLEGEGDLVAFDYRI
jgi:hypothetical protein